MELRLSEGKYVMGKYRDFEHVDGTQEVLQRVMMKLKTRRGDYLPMPAYGSRLHMLSGIKPSQLKTNAKQFVQEALADESELELLELELTQMKNDEIKLELSFAYKGDIRLEAETII